MRAIRKIIGSLAAGVAITACAASGPAPSLDQQLAQRNFEIIGPVEQVQNYRLMGWNNLDRKHVIIHSTPSTSYLVTLRQPCQNLMSAETIGFTTTVGNLTLFDSLLVNQRPGGYLERCWIENLQELKKTEKMTA